VADVSPVADLLRRWNEGDEAAAAELFHRYAARLTRVADEHLSRRLAGRAEGEDVVQSVFRTFFRRSASGEFRIDSSAQIWQLLVKITLMKARGKARFHRAAKRSVDVEVGAAEQDAWLHEVLARDPDPAEAAELVDQLEELMRGLPPLYCRILDLRLQGHNPTEIAGELRVSRQTVYRALDLLQQRLAESERRANAEQNG
jgi:RNA polymerase sigma factor (sigma-70 family)